MHEHIDEMGIINMNGRIYDPLIGRFMSADPYIQAPSDLQSFNRYAYVRNNPLNLTDPSGYSWWTKLRDKFIKPLVAKLIDPFCGGCATIGLNAWNAYWTKDANGHRLGWKGVFFSFGMTLLGGVSDSPIWQAGVNMLSGCGMSAMAGGSCKRGALEALTNEAVGPIAGGCINARRAGGSCAVGAREGATTLLGNQMAQNTANEAHRWNDERINYNAAVQANAEADEPVQMAQVSQGLRGAAGNPALQHLSPTVCDAGCGGGLGLRPSVQLPRMPELNLWNILPFPLKIVGLAWVLSTDNKPPLSDYVDALDKVHDQVGKLPKGEDGKFGSPQAGDSKKGYRLDPPHDGAAQGDAESKYHFNWWDYTGGKRGKGGRSGAIPIGD